MLCFVLTVSLCFSGCTPRDLPGFKQLSQREEDRITRETDEAIKKSAELQELDRLCTQQIPRPDGFVLVRKYRDFHENRFLGYGYHSTQPYPAVKEYYQRYFGEQGWQSTNEQKGGAWGDPKIEFRNDKYRVIIYDVGTSPRFRYVLDCGRL